jgi:hypothetical protein
LISGLIELYVERSDYSSILLDTLVPGSNLGGYSVLNQSSYRYTAKAKGNVSILVLDQVDLFSFGEVYEEISSAIENGTKFIFNNDLPLCDYHVADLLHGSVKNAHKNIYSKLKNAVRRQSVFSEKLNHAKKSMVKNDNRRTTAINRPPTFNKKKT